MGNLCQIRTEPKQKSSSDESEELFKYVVDSIVEAIDLTYLSPIFIGAGRGTLSHFHVTGCQGFIGPFPSAFLDKRC